MCRWGVAAGSLGSSASDLQAQPAELSTGVRSTVVDKLVFGADQKKSPEATGHGRRYGIVAVQEIKSEEELIRPVNEPALMGLLIHILDAHGFRRITLGEQPEIVLTLSYGRGKLPNPYVRVLGDTTAVAPLPSDKSAGGARDASAAEVAPPVRLRAAFLQQLIDENTARYQAKLRRADLEKIYLRVTAWDCPLDSTANSKLLWQTTMVADDPGHLDLNAVAAAMLEAGSPYFDREIEQEVDVHQPLAARRVNVGSPEAVVRTAPPSRK